MNRIDLLNFQAVKDRGVFTDNYTAIDFLKKLKEEVEEVEEAIKNNDVENVKEELTDLIVLAQNELIRKGFDPTIEKHKCWIKNKNRSLCQNTK